MGQINIYVPDQVEAEIKKRAKREGKSVSSLVVEAVQKHVAPASWSPAFLALLRSEPLEFPERKDSVPPRRKSFD